MFTEEEHQNHDALSTYLYSDSFSQSCVRYFDKHENMATSLVN